MTNHASTPRIHSLFDPNTWTATHVVYEQDGGPCAVIDPVLDFDQKSGRIRHGSAEKVRDFIAAHQLKLEWILETHAHADHLSAAAWLKHTLGGKTGVGAHINEVQRAFKDIFNLEPGFQTDGSQFDRLLAEGDTLQLGSLTGHVLAVPGHTPACLAYQFGDAVFVGDTLFMPDVGTARCDFPGGDAKALYASIQKLLQLPGSTRLYMCHDYPPGNRPIALESTVAQQRSSNIHVHDGISEREFVEMRTARDATLEMPVLMLPSIQVNIRAGELPPAENNGTSYLKTPINKL